MNQLVLWVFFNCLDKKLSAIDWQAVAQFSYNLFMKHSVSSFYRFISFVVLIGLVVWTFTFRWIFTAISVAIIMIHTVHLLAYSLLSFSAICCSLQEFAIPHLSVLSTRQQEHLCNTSFNPSISTG